MKHISFISLAILLFMVSCSSHDSPPVAEFSFEPQIGNTRSDYFFDASLSSDPDDSTGSLQYRWDWESDLDWDTDFSSVPFAAHKFLKGGTHKVRLEIKDPNGNLNYTEKEINVIQINSGRFIDARDGHEYQWITMGNQTWMAENLSWDAGQGSWYYWRSQYGRHYDWETAINACPEGWQLPSDNDWAMLEIAYGMQVWNRSTGFDESGEIGYKFKSRTGWQADCNGTNEYEFNITPAGYRNFNGKYARSRMMSYFWTSTEAGNMHAYNRGFHYGSKGISRDTTDKRVGFSVRCIKKQGTEDITMPITTILRN